jgi:hypothetical protein
MAGCRQKSIIMTFFLSVLWSGNSVDTRVCSPARVFVYIVAQEGLPASGESWGYTRGWSRNKH